jgi:hypothetical protein
MNTRENGQGRHAVVPGGSLAERLESYAPIWCLTRRAVRHERRAGSQTSDTNRPRRS